MKRVALVHDWLVTHRGGEKVLLEIARGFPEAPIFTLVHDPARVHPELAARTIHTSFVQQLPGAPRRFRQYLPLFPRAIEAFDLSGYDAILSTSHCVAKGVPVQSGQVHVSYVHTPMRYLYDQLPAYLPVVPGRELLEPAAQLALEPLRAWDLASAGRPTALIANSRHVAQRIERLWGREAEVVHPPVDVDYWAQAPERARHGYLVVSALVPYKRVDLAVQVASRWRLPLTVIGTGSERRRLESLAGSTVRFVGAATDDQVREAYASHRALLFPGVEDFGMVPVEAMAAGCPVVALARGGAVETVLPPGSRGGPTGALFEEETVEGLGAALDHSERMLQRGELDPARLLAQARCFDVAAFGRAYREVLARHGIAMTSTS